MTTPLSSVSSGSSGWTRLDALALASTVALLTVLTLAGLGAARPPSAAVGCLNAQRQLLLAWHMYANDHQGWLVANMGISDALADQNARTYRNWASGIMTWGTGAGMDADNTNAALLLRGGLGVYVGDDPTGFHCPSDRYVSPPQRARGWSHRVRSRAMNTFMGRYSYSSSDTSLTGRNPFFSQYRQYLRLSDLTQPDQRFVLLDEHPDSINDGYFLNQPSPTSWGDLPAAFHEGAGSFGMADGRAELHRWRSRTTRLPVRYQYRIPVFDASGREDFAWYKTHAGFELIR